MCFVKKWLYKINKNVFFLTAIPVIVLLLVSISVIIEKIFSLEDKMLLYNGQPISVSREIIYYQYIPQNIFPDKERIYFTGTVGEDEYMTFYFEFNQFEKNQIECNLHSFTKDEINLYKEIIIDGNRYWIDTNSPSKLCSVLTPQGEQSDDIFYVYNFAEKKVIGEFEAFNSGYAINYDDTKVIYLQKYEEAGKMLQWRVMLTDIESQSATCILQTQHYIDADTFRWINNEEVTFQGDNSKAYWGTMYAFNYNTSTKKLKTYSHFDTYFNDKPEPERKNVFWTPNGEKVFYVYVDTNQVRRWK